MISYNDFCRLRADVADCDSVDHYIAEVGSSVPEDNLRLTIKALELIWSIGAAPDVRCLRKLTGLSQAAFAREYQMSLSSLSKWEQGNVTMPIYALPLLAYAVFTDLLGAADNPGWQKEGGS